MYVPHTQMSYMPSHHLSVVTIRTYSMFYWDIVSEIMAVHTHFTTNVSQMHYDRVYNC